MALFTRIVGKVYIPRNTLHNSVVMGCGRGRGLLTCMQDRRYFRLDERASSLEPPPRYYRSYWKDIALDWLSRFLGIAAGTIVALGTGGVILLCNNVRMMNQLDKRIANGNCHDDPGQGIRGSCIERGEVIQEIVKRFISGSTAESKNSFGVILGPTGTGKTYAIRKACFENRHGTMYFEVRAIELLPQLLAEELGMRTKPGIVGTLMGRFFPSFPSHFSLPSNDDKCLVYVICTIAERARIYTRRHHGHRPTLFIDGADLLVKRNEEVFSKLVDLAKTYANEGGLRIVFGCSEGSIMPLLEDMSASSRCEVMEVLDIQKDKAVKYLEERGLKEDLAHDIVDKIGSRLIFLERGAGMYNSYKDLFGSKAEVMQNVLDDLEQLFTKRGTEAIVKEMPTSIEVLKHLIKTGNDGFVSSRYIRECKKQSPAKEEAIRRTINSLIKTNTLRYTRKGKLTWHSSLMEKTAKRAFKDDLLD